MSQTEEPQKKLARECPKCGNLYAPSLAFCPTDGNKLAEDLIVTERTLLNVSESDTIRTTTGQRGGSQTRLPTIGDGTELIGMAVDDRYELEKIIGSGGMSIVYRARDISLKKTIAVKMLLPHMMMLPMAFQRFQQEAQAASNLSHPNIVSVYSFGAPAGHAYIAMDYLEGRSLSQLLDETKTLSIDRALHIFMQVCDALGHAHSKGVIHRDLKPSNIILIQNGSDPDFVKIVDFGIAKVLNQEGPEAMRLTQTGEIFGSPIYMSPEQCKGEKLDIRADIYSLGCLMYEALAGSPPHTGTTSLEVLYKHSHDVPPPMSRGNTIRFPQSLERIIFRTLAKDPGARYPNMQALRRDLLTIAKERKLGILSKVKDQIELLWLKRRPKSAHEKAIAWVCGFLLLTVMSLGMWIFHLYWTAINSPASKVALDWHETSQTLDVPDSELQAALLKVPIIQSQDNEMDKVKSLFSNDGIFMKAGHYQQALTQLQRDYQLCLRINGTEAFYTKLIEESMAECYFKLGQLDNAKRMYDRIFPFARQLPLPLKGLAKDAFTYGEICRMQGDIKDAEAAYAKSISLWNDSGDRWKWNSAHVEYDLHLPDQPPGEEFALIVARLADIDFLRKDYPEARRLYEKVISYYDPAAQSAPALIEASSEQRYLMDAIINDAIAHDRLSKTLLRTNNNSGALSNATTAVELMEKVRGRSSVYTALIIRDKADALWACGQYAGSLMEEYHALTILAKAE